MRPKDAKTGNLVLIDVRNAGNEQDVLLGEWDGQYHLGTVSTREVDATSIVNDASTKSTKSKSKESKSKESKSKESKSKESKSKESKSTNKSKEYLLHLVMWEPYIQDADGLLRPLWVQNALRAKNGDELLPSKWQDVVRHAWCPIMQLPLHHSRKILNNPDFIPPKKRACL